MVVYVRREYIVEERGEKAPYLHSITPTGTKQPTNGYFADLRANQDDKFAFVYDESAPNKEAAAKLAEDDRFLEVCDFEFFNCYNEKIVDGWSGTFIDVFAWLRQNMYDIQREAGDCA
ncbi:hypothetical protein FACS189487_02690 [Campylobacterota bacterium]|nr:hypothetical protein FACS189487_02690 [Campylobacterota bacterium]